METQQSISEWGQATFSLDALGIAVRMSAEVAELLIGIETFRYAGSTHVIVDLDERVKAVVGECADVYIMAVQVASALDLALMPLTERKPRALASGTLLDVAVAAHVKTGGLLRELTNDNRGQARLCVESLIEKLLNISAVFEFNLAEAVEAKMAVNRQRSWARQANGKVQHV